MATDITLELRTNNPYSNGTLSQFDDGDIVLERTPLKYTPNEKDRYYQVTDGDTLGLIAYQAYQDSKLWWIISDINEIDNPLFLEIGKILLIPDLQVIQILNF